jgi:hypothetical protein
MVDLIEDFAFRLQVTIICDMREFRQEHRGAFYAGSRDRRRVLERCR